MANWPLRPMGRLVVLIGLAMASALVLPDSGDAASLHEVAKLVNSDPFSFDQFGYSVSLSDDTVIAGARFEDDGGTNSGAAFLFHRDEGGADNWGEVKKLTASDADPFDFFGRSVAISVDTAVVGAHGEDTGGSSAGAVYVFQRNQGGANNWGEVKKLIASDAQAGDRFGGSVAISGDIVVVGAPNEDSPIGNPKGAIYVFRRDEGGPSNWGEVKKLTASDSSFGDELGKSVGVDGDTVIAGAPSLDVRVGLIAAGAAYIFQRDEGGANNWGEVKKLIASDVQTGDKFGTSVAVSNATAVVGACCEDTEGLNAGAAYVFDRDQGGADGWGEVKKVTATDAEVGHEFGTSVAVSDSTAIVGAFLEGQGGDEPGAAYVFERDEGGLASWGQAAKLTASDAQTFDKFGWGVSISGDNVVVGAYGVDIPQGEFLGDHEGAAYVFDLLGNKNTPAATPTSTFTPHPSSTPDPVGGISLDPDLRPLASETTQPSSLPWGIVLVSLAISSLVAVGGAAWYARKRFTGW